SRSSRRTLLLLLRSANRSRLVGEPCVVKLAGSFSAPCCFYRVLLAQRSIGIHLVKEPLLEYAASLGCVLERIVLRSQRKAAKARLGQSLPCRHQKDDLLLEVVSSCQSS